MPVLCLHLIVSFDLANVAYHQIEEGASKQVTSTVVNTLSCTYLNNEASTAFIVVLFLNSVDWSLSWESKHS